MTKQADYGIVLLTQMARTPARRSTAPELAAETHLPLPTVSKILKLLVKEGLLASQRGVKGGYSLAIAPDEISVADMIAALEGPIAFTECAEDTPGLCSQEAVCGLRASWQSISDAVRRALENISLAELSSPRHELLVQLGSGSASYLPVPASATD